MESQQRAKILYATTGIFSTLFLLALIWAMRSLIVPTLVGGLIAYMCFPWLKFFKRKGLPDFLAIPALLGFFILSVLLISIQIRDIMPDENGKLILRTRIQYKMNEKYQEYMGIQKGGKGNMIYNLVGKEIDPILKDVIDVLQLDREERAQFSHYYNLNYTKQPELTKYRSYFFRNMAKQRQAKDDLKSLSPLDSGFEENVDESQNGGASLLSKIGEIISIWLVAPFVFLFLLVDQGQIKKNMIALVPNRYFEMVLTIIDNVDEAIGKYLRGTFLECSLVGSTFIICLFLIGVELQWAIIIGIIAGAANAIPFLGPAIGLVVGMIYALIAESVVPVLPFVSPEDLVVWVLVTVGIAQTMDNAVFQPIVLGSAVSLHPLVVIFGVMGGSIIFGFAGMLFAIPAIVIVKVIISTLFDELKAYHLI